MTGNGGAPTVMWKARFCQNRSPSITGIENRVQAWVGGVVSKSPQSTVGLVNTAANWSVCACVSRPAG